VGYSNENTQRVIEAFNGKNMDLDDGSKWHFSVQQPPSNWAAQDKVVVEKAGMMYTVRNLTKKSNGIAAFIQDALETTPKDNTKKFLEPICDEELTIVKIHPDGLIELNEGPSYRPGGVNPAKIDYKMWEPGNAVKLVSKNSRFGLCEMQNLTKRRSMDVMQDK